MKRLVLAATLLAVATGASARQHPREVGPLRSDGTPVMPRDVATGGDRATMDQRAPGDRAATGNERRPEENYTVHPLTHQYGPYALRAPR